jgi:hypothetical protein
MKISPFFLDLSREEKLSKAKAEVKRDKRFLAIFKEELKNRNLSPQELDLKNSSVDERVSSIVRQVETLGSKARVVEYLKDLKAKGVLTASVLEILKAEHKELFTSLR